MYAIEKRLKQINGEPVEIFSREIEKSKTGLLVEAGTTGCSGGIYREAGGRTYIGILCKRGDFYFRSIQNSHGQNIGVEIACCGDEGLDAVMKSLTFAQNVIYDQCCKSDG